MSLKYQKILQVILIYFLIGFIYGMEGEMRLAQKYGQSYWRALRDPWAYTRSIIFSPVWPVDLYWTLYHYDR